MNEEERSLTAVDQFKLAVPEQSSNGWKWCGNPYTSLVFSVVSSSQIQGFSHLRMGVFEMPKHYTVDTIVGNSGMKLALYVILSGSSSPAGRLAVLVPSSRQVNPYHQHFDTLYKYWSTR